MVASEQRLYQTILLPKLLATGSIHDYIFCYCPLVGSLLEVVPSSGYSICGTQNLEVIPC